MRRLTNAKIESFKQQLIEQERSEKTVERYIRDIKAFRDWNGGWALNKQTVLNYKAYLCSSYATSSTNSILSALNSFFAFCEWHELRTRSLKQQKQIFSREERELSRAEYERLILRAEQNRDRRLSLLLQTICATGIRISELKFITAEAALAKAAVIYSKGKERCIFLPQDLCKMLLEYADEQRIKRGPVFITKTGCELDRSNIWLMMKRLAADAGVPPEKVYPHNFRHLFARAHYTAHKDIVRLADVLGHSSTNTTRIYTAESGSIHRKQIEELGLLFSKAT